MTNGDSKASEGVPLRVYSGFLSKLKKNIMNVSSKTKIGGVRMKNKKFMAMILVLSMMLMGAGYAAWTQSFDVEATVDTGELKVVYHEGGSIFGQMWVEEFPYQTSTYEFDENTFEMDLNDVYPGLDICVVQQMVNVGTIPAVFDGATVVFSDDTDQALKDDMVITYNDFRVVDENGSIKEFLNGPQQVAISQLESELNTRLANVRLEPGDTLVLGDALQHHFDFVLPSDTDDSTENSHLGLTITMNFKQFNK